LFKFFFEKPPKPSFPISDRVLIVLGDPLQQWPALKVMEKNKEKKLFSRVKYDNLTSGPLSENLLGM
jgi:hypothetical protein